MADKICKKKCVNYTKNSEEVICLRWYDVKVDSSLERILLGAALIRGLGVQFHLQLGFTFVLVDSQFRLWAA